MRRVALRVGTAAMALVGAALVAFLALRVAPGDPARLTLGAFASDEAVAALRAEMGLDRSLPEQFVRYLWDFVTLDWGRSYALGQPVRALLADRFPATLELGLAAFTLALVAAVALALAGAWRPRGAVDRGAGALGILALGVPQFWFGLMALILGAEVLGWFPGPAGRLPAGMPPPPTVTGLMTLDAVLAGDGPALLAALHHLALPALTLALLPFGFLMRLLRANLADAAAEPYALVARAHGQGRARVFFGTVLPNAIVPTLTAAGLILGQLLAGSVLVEKVFNWPGAGLLVTQGVLQQDFSVVQTFILLSAVIYIAANLAVDLLAAALDPRQRDGA